ncbi:hypothetical protein E8E11_008571 [Didymella keratinophila]|nr:hypothetical protein E8E11_008571 [Didymella keratinophila]
MGRVTLPSKQEIAAPFISTAAFVDFIRSPQDNEGQVTVGNARWSNKDLEPTPEKDRTWTWYNLPLYWFSNQFSLVGWNTGSALVTVGLTWQQSPVLVRSVMGMYGGYFFVFIRAIVCIIWYGIQTFYAGNILSVMLRCIFGSSWENFPNALPAGANVTSKQLLTFFMAWLMEFPFM